MSADGHQGELEAPLPLFKTQIWNKNQDLNYFITKTCICNTFKNVLWIL